MSSVLGSLLHSLLHRGEVHDYAHAAQVFRTNNYARSPKYKFLFQVNFILSADAPSFISTREVSYLVKNIDLPKFTVDVKDLNQYNRHTYIQNRIKYEPITIKFHDDTGNGLRELWQNYYNYYFADGTYQLNDYNYDDRYQQRLHSSWGLDQGSTTPFFSAIEIYSLASGVSNKITLMSPIITSFSHDNHDYSDGQGIMEATMQIRYNGVVYEDGYAINTPGFGDPQFYDGYRSGLTPNYHGYVVDPRTGQLISAPDGFVNPYNLRQTQNSGFGFVNQTNQYYPSSSLGFTDYELGSIINNNRQTNYNGDLVFPIANTVSPLYTQNPNDVIAFAENGAVAVSNGEIVESATQLDTLYPTGSFQHNLFNQGYTIPQITSAAEFIATVPDSTLSLYEFGSTNPVIAKTYLAQQYIDNPDSVSNIGTVNYGQPSYIPSNIDFTNPASPSNPIYNNQTWQNILLDQGYSDSDIAYAASQISGLKLPPGTDLVPIAKSYISYRKNNNS